MEQNQNCCVSLYDQLPPLSANFPWLVAQNLEAKDETDQVQIFYTIDDSLPHYRCQIPELLGRLIHGCFHGWVILSDHPQNVAWSLWNPITSEIICLPPLLLKDDEDSDYIECCCLLSPPGDPESILLLARSETPNIVFCRLDDCEKNTKLRWTEMSYAEQVRNLFDLDGLLRCTSYCNDKVYAFVLLKSSPTLSEHYLVQVDIVVKDTQVLISILPILDIPSPSFYGFCDVIPFLKASFTELFVISVAFKDEMRTTVGGVCLFKLNMSSTITWEEMDDLKDTVMFVELTNVVNSVFYSSAVTTNLGGYIHILGDEDKITYSYHVKDKTLSLSSIPCLVGTSHVSAWEMLECRFEGDHVEGKCTTDFKQEKEVTDNEIVVRSDDEVKFISSTGESHLLNIPFHLLEMIMEFHVGIIEYLKFRATCKRCHLAAPLIQWRASKRLQTYSLVSPWLMVFDKHQGIITFTDSMFGDKYFINTPQDLICDFQIYCSKDGWLLLGIDEGPLLFFNPFTRDICKLPEAHYLDGFCFSAPPTSPDCMVVAFGSGLWFICFVAAREPSWRLLYMYLDDDNPYTCSYLTFSGQKLYALCNEGKVDEFEDMDKEDFSWGPVVSKAPTSCGSMGQYFLVNCDRHLLLVMVGKHGQSVEVFKSNDYEEKWEKIDGIGRHTIYICDTTTCLCIDARTPEMENKIYFPRSRSKNGNMVFYSLETCRYHTLNGDNSEESLGDFLGTKHHLSPHAWIEPSWS